MKMKEETRTTVRRTIEMTDDEIKHLIADFFKKQTDDEGFTFDLDWDIGQVFNGATIYLVKEEKK